MTLKVYVAGASAEIDRCEAMIEKVGGHAQMEITHDWAATIRSVGTPDIELPLAEKLKYATDDVQAVERADVFWLLLPSKPSIGCWVELGVAIQSHTTIIVSGSDGRSPLFCAFAYKEFGADWDAWLALEKIAETKP